MSLASPELDRFNLSGAELASVGSDAPSRTGLEQYQELLNVAHALDADSLLDFEGKAPGKIKGAMQAVYALAASRLHLQQHQRVAAAMTAQPMSELYTEGFDTEQIWMQLDLLDAAVFKRCRRAVRGLSEGVVLLDEDMEDAVDTLLAGTSGQGGTELAPSGREHTRSREGSGDKVGNEAGLAEDISGSRSVGSSDNESDLSLPGVAARGLEDIDYDAMLVAGSAHISDKTLREHGAPAELRRSGYVAAAGAEGVPGSEEALLPTEDEFFRLTDMEAFVQQAEVAEAAGDRGGLSLVARDADAARRGPGPAGTGMLGGEFGSESGGGSGSEDDDGEGSAGRESSGEEGSEGREGSEDDVDLYSDYRAEDSEGSGPNGSEIRYEDFFGPAQPYGVSRAGRSAPVAREPHMAAGLATGHSLALGVSQREQVEEDGAGGDPSSESDSERAAAVMPPPPILSAHAQREASLRKQVAALEAAALAEAPWHLRGEVSGGGRPLNSALEVDLDFETTVPPPPEPTEEVASALEEVIKRRVLEMRFDNVVRVAVGPERKVKARLEAVSEELDGSRSKRGLAEEYADDYVRSVAGTAVDANAAVRKEAKGLFAQLCAQLDALSHLSYAPKPLVTDMEVAVDAPAIAMEEATPAVVSAAALKAPEEAHAKSQQRKQKAEDELTQSERKQRRAAKKRIKRRREAEREEAAGAARHPRGLKSAREDEALERQMKEQARKKESKSKENKSAGPVLNSSGVFKQLAAEAGAKEVSTSKSMPSRGNSSNATRSRGVLSGTQLRM